MKIILRIQASFLKAFDSHLSYYDFFTYELLGLQRADAMLEMVARTLGPRWCSIERSLVSGLRCDERMEKIGRG